MGPAEPDKQKPGCLGDNISILSHFRNLVCLTADFTEPVCRQTDQVRVLVLVQLLTTLFGEVGQISQKLIALCGVLVKSYAAKQENKIWLDPEKLPFVLLPTKLTLPIIAQLRSPTTAAIANFKTAGIFTQPRIPHNQI